MDNQERAHEWLHLVRTLRDAVNQLELLAIGDVTIRPSNIKHQIYRLITECQDIAQEWYMKEDDNG